jgi:hypothetical protein
MLAAMFAACALFGAADARSQQPSPSSREPRHPAQAQSNGPQQPAATDQRGTEQSPIIVKVLPTPKTDAETAQEAEDRKEKSANDRNLVRYTG